MSKAKEIVIRNISKIPRIFTLTHGEVCKKVGQCFCKNGKPRSVHAPVNVDTPTVVAVLQCQEVLDAVRAKQIDIIPIEKATGRPSKPGTEAKAGKKVKAKGQKKNK
jgi:hypothetical protein